MTGAENTKGTEGMRRLARRVPHRDHGAKAPGKESTGETEQQGAREGKLRDWAPGEPRAGGLGAYRSLH